MASRNEILAAIRSLPRRVAARPDVNARVSEFPAHADLVVRFTEAAEAAAAQVVDGPRADLSLLIDAAYPAIGRQVSAMLAEEAHAGTLAPHSFADTDVFVCEAVLGIAENGAVWLPLSRLRHRAALFLATNVIIVLDRAGIVGNLHDAYARIDVAEDGFGVLVAGPSKTADIEQALVIGAHGAKSLTILLVE